MIALYIYPVLIVAVVGLYFVIDYAIDNNHNPF